jgi:hypothetical protein
MPEGLSQVQQDQVQSLFEHTLQELLRITKRTTLPAVAAQKLWDELFQAAQVAHGLGTKG